MSKLREALGLPTDGDVTVDQIEEAFAFVSSAGGMKSVIVFP